MDLTGLMATGEVAFVVCEATLGDVQSSLAGPGTFLGVSGTLEIDATGITKGSVQE